MEWQVPEAQQEVSGFPLSFIKLDQQLGRLDCGGVTPVRPNVYIVHIDVCSYILLCVRIMQW